MAMLPTKLSTDLVGNVLTLPVIDRKVCSECRFPFLSLQ